MVLRFVFAAAAAVLLTSAPPALAGAKFIHVPAAIPTLSGPLYAHGFGGGRKLRLLPGLAPAPGAPVYFPAGRVWIDRNYLRGPDFPTMDRQLQSRIPPGATLSNAANPFRQRIAPSRTAGNGSPWTGAFTGGPTVQRGSMWAGGTYR